MSWSRSTKRAFSRLRNFAFTAGLLAFSSIVPASATTFYITDFSVDLNGATLFSDSFDDGIAPPSAPNFLFPDSDPATYDVKGTIFESDGKALLDAVNNGVDATNIPGAPVFVVRSQLITPQDDTSARNLGPEDTFTVSGVFDLVMPGTTTEQYRIRLTDNVSDRNDFITLSVQRRVSDNQVFIRFRQGDDETGIVTVLGEIAIDLTGNPDQIRLSLAKLSAGSNEITASFEYIKDGSSIGGQTFSNTVPIFHGENFTRGDFIAQIHQKFAAPILAAELTTGSPTTLSQNVSTPSTLFTLTFDYLFETTTGVLDVTINGQLIGSLSAPGTLAGVFQQASFVVSDFLLSGLPNALLEFTLDGPTGSKLLLDNIAGLALINGDFQTGNLTGWQSTFSGNGSVGVATLAPNAVPIPAALPLFAAGLGAMGFMGWRSKRNTVPRLNMLQDSARDGDCCGLSTTALVTISTPPSRSSGRHQTREI
jgi:hypothetical protein